LRNSDLEGGDERSFEVFLVPEELARDLVADGTARRVRVKRGAAVEWVVTSLTVGAPVAIQLLQGPEVLEYYLAKVRNIARSRNGGQSKVLVHIKGPRGEVDARLDETIAPDVLKALTLICVRDSSGQ